MKVFNKIILTALLICTAHDILGSSANQESFPGGHQTLIEAITQKELSRVQEYIHANPGAVFAKNNRGKTALHCAAHESTPQIIQKLIEAGSDVNAEMLDGRTALWFAVADSNIDNVRVLVQNGAKINITTVADIFPPPIVVAATRKNPDILYYLATNGARLQATDDQGNTPLHHAARIGNATGVHFLLSRSSTKNPLNQLHEPPLYQAAKAGHLPVVQMFVTHGVSSHTDGFLPLCGAAAQGHIEVVKFLIACNPKCIDETDHLGYTAVEWAIGYGRLDVVLFLLGQGALLKKPKKSSFFIANRNPIIFSDPTIEIDEKTIVRWQQALTFLLIYGAPFGKFGVTILQQNPEINDTTQDVNLSILNTLCPNLPRDIQRLVLVFVAIINSPLAHKRSLTDLAPPPTIAKKQRKK